MKRKNAKSIKRSKTITQQPKAIENPSTADIKPAFIEHSQNSCKLSKAIRLKKSEKAEKVSQLASGNISNVPL